MKVLFFPQNATHLDNMIPVADILHKNGIDVVFLNTENIYKQNLLFETEHPVQTLDLKLQQSFYKLGVVDRIKFIRTHRAVFLQYAKQFDFFIFGNDGALQRIIINYAKKNNKSTFIILDGMISDYSYSLMDIVRNDLNDLKKNLLLWIKVFIKNTLSNIAKRVPFNCYLPSNAGCSEVDAVFVIGEHSKKALMKLCSQTKTYTYGLPYMKRLFQSTDLKQKKESRPNESTEVLFLSSAYKWHGLNHLHDIQHKDISLLCSIISKSKRTIILNIKLHPREDSTDYETYTQYSFVNLITSGNLDKHLLQSDILFSHISTTIIEALMLKKKIYSLMINFPYWKYKNSFISNEAIEKVFSVTQLIDIIEENKKTDADVNFDVSDKIYDLIAPTTPESATMISTKIISLLDKRRTNNG